MPVYIGPEGRPPVETVNDWLDLLYSTPTITQRTKIADETFAQTMAKARREHPEPDSTDTPQDLPAQSSNTDPGSKLLEVYHTKKFTPQTRDLEGQKGVHTIMDKRPAPVMGAKNPREVFVDEELYTRRLVYTPKRKGWGTKNQTRDDFCADFPKIFRKRKPQIAKWLKENPNRPETPLVQKLYDSIPD